MDLYAWTEWTYLVVSAYSLHFHVDGHPIKQHGWSEVYSYCPGRGPHLHTTEQLQWPWGDGEFGSIPSDSLSWSLVRKQTPECPETRYCLEIQVTSTEDGGATPPPTHAWQGTHGRRHALGWQIWPHRSSHDRPRPGHPFLWKMIPRRRT